VHDDPNYSNILIDESGRICGIVDWEFHALQPAILAASYTPWLEYDGCEDPRFCPDNTWWLESRAESKRLCGIFEEVRIVYELVSASQYHLLLDCKRLSTTQL
jgi:hypothetical protein